MFKMGYKLKKRSKINIFLKSKFIIESLDNFYSLTQNRKYDCVRVIFKLC